MRRTVLGILFVWAAALCVPSLVSAKVRGSEVMYLSGTVREVPLKTEGHLFQPKNSEVEFRSNEGEILIPLSRVRSAKYRETLLNKKGVQQPAADAAATPRKQVKIPLLPALPGLPSLSPFGEAKERVLTLVYADKKGAEQTVVLLLARKMVAPVIYAIENYGKLEVELEPGDYELDGEE